MDGQTEQQKPAGTQLIFVPHKDTVRLLEVYVKRSLSLNEGTTDFREKKKTEKWVTVPRRVRRHSSDPSVHLNETSHQNGPDETFVVEPSTEEPEPRPEEPEKPSKKSKKVKKPSFWKNLLGFFSRKTSEDSEEKEESPGETSDGSEATITCVPTPPVSQRKKTLRRKSLRRRLSKRRLSINKVNKSSKDLNPADITEVSDGVSVEATYSYYENVSVELEKIIHEVKVQEEEEPLSNEELIKRFIALTKVEGDAIDDKLKDNPTLNNFFQGLTYQSFQKLADAYVEMEVTPTQSPPTIPPTAPELVKLAFTLDFTARIAGLSRQNIGYITRLGNRYLQDRFEYTQACSDHPLSDSDD